VGAARIICFNPNAEENGYLRKSLALNGWQDRCEIIEKGLYSKTGWLNDMSQAFSENEVPGSFAVWAFDDLELSVPSGVPLWVKLDVEGAEVEVLKGMTKFIGGFRPVLLIENHQFKDASIQTRVEVELARHGYTAVSHHPYHGVSHSLYRPGAGG
jgi:FkbM family methyltransferase